MRCLVPEGVGEGEVSALDWEEEEEEEEEGEGGGEADKLLEREHGRFLLPPRSRK